MRRLVKLLLWAGWTAAVGAGMLSSPGQGQGPVPGGLPPGVIAKNPAESELSLTVWMGRPLYLQGAPAAEFVRLRINQEAFVYLYEVAPSGEVRLLLPNRAAPENFLAPGEYAFPEDFLPPFPIGEEGEHVVQALATRTAIPLPPGRELFRLLGSDPSAIPRSLEALIRDQGLTPRDWAADWTSYRVTRTLPTAGATGSIVVRAVDETGNELPPSAEPRVWLDRLNAAGEVEARTGWTPVPPGGKWFALEAGKPHRLRVKVREGFFEPEIQDDCTLIPPGVGERTRSPCEFTVGPSDRDLPVLFEFRAPGATERVTRFRYELPVCAGRPVRFDASASGPEEEIQLYIWDFADPTAPDPVASPGPFVEHTYYVPGSYEVRLTVLYRDGESRSADPEISGPLTVLPARAEDCRERPPRPVQGTGDGEALILDRVITLRARDGSVWVPQVPFVEDPKVGNAVRVSLRYEFTQLPPAPEMGTKVFAQVRAFVEIRDAQAQLLRTEEVCRPLDTAPTPPLLPLVNRLTACEQVVSLQDLLSQRGLRRSELDVRVGLELNVASRADASGVPVSVRFVFDEESLEALESPECAVLRTDKVSYRVGEPVRIEFFNGCGGEIWLPNSAPWLIKDGNRVVVFVPDQTPGPLAVAPGEVRTWTWEQEDNAGQPVLPRAEAETFRVEFETSEGRYLVNFTIAR